MHLNRWYPGNASYLGSSHRSAVQCINILPGLLSTCPDTMLQSTFCRLIPICTIESRCSSNHLKADDTNRMWHPLYRIRGIRYLSNATYSSDNTHLSNQSYQNGNNSRIGINSPKHKIPGPMWYRNMICLASTDSSLLAFLLLELSSTYKQNTNLVIRY